MTPEPRLEHPMTFPQISRTIALVDPRALIADCFSFLLARRASDLHICCARSIDGLSEEDPALLVVWQEAIDQPALDFLERQIAAAHERYPDTPALAFIHCEDAAVLARVFGLGIAVVDAKSATPDVALAAIRLAMTGERFASAAFLTAGPRPDHGLSIEQNGAAASTTAWPRNGITRRERQLLDKLDRGLQNKIIAYELGISESTVKVHLRNLMRKLKATNRTQVAFIARQMAVKH